MRSRPNRQKRTTYRRPPPGKKKPQPNRYVFTRRDCQKGYSNALAAAMAVSWARYAWLYYRIRGFYRARKRLEAECPF